MGTVSLSQSSLLIMCSLNRANGLPWVYCTWPETCESLTILLPSKLNFSRQVCPMLAQLFTLAFFVWLAMHAFTMINALADGSPSLAAVFFWAFLPFLAGRASPASAPISLAAAGSSNVLMSAVLQDCHQDRPPSHSLHASMWVRAAAMFEQARCRAWCHFALFVSNSGCAVYLGRQVNKLLLNRELLIHRSVLGQRS